MRVNANAVLHSWTLLAAFGGSYAPGISQIEWKLKVKTDIQFSHRAKIGQNDHSNPYIENTTVLSDIYLLYRIYKINIKT